MPSHLPAEAWLTTLDHYTARLADRLHLLGLQSRGRDAPSALAAVTAVEELTTAGEELRASSEELRTQAAELADAHGALEVARRHYQELFDLCPDTYLVTDCAGIIREANLATSALVGYARSYVLGKPLTALLDPSTTATFVSLLNTLRQVPDDRPQTWDLTLRPRRSEPPRQASIRVSPLRDTTGSLAGFRWLLRDVTEQRAMAAALVEMQATQAQTLRTRTMELEAIVRMKDAARAHDQAVLQRLVDDSIQALEDGAAPGALLTEVLSTVQAHLNGHAMPADIPTASD